MNLSAAIYNLGFRNAIVADFEYFGARGDNPMPLMVDAIELPSGRRFCHFGDDLSRLVEAPYPLDTETLFIAYNAPAELRCHEQLGWAHPIYILDPFIEFKNLMNGLYLPQGHGLIGACQYFNIPTRSIEEKDRMRDLILAGGPFSGEEREAIIRYCHEDVLNTLAVTESLLPRIDLRRAIGIRGRATKGIALQESAGIHIDAEAHGSIIQNFGRLRGAMIDDLDAEYGLWDHWENQFRRKRFERFVALHGMRHPRLPSGQLMLDRQTLEQQAEIYPVLKPVLELRRHAGQLHLGKLPVGRDGRNRSYSGSFGTLTSRNRPLNSQYALSQPAGLRPVIQAPPGRAYANIDFVQEEFFVAAAISGDEAMLRDYLSGKDLYIAAGQRVGFLPDGATKESHSTERDLFKQVVLGIQYGMQAETLAGRIRQSSLHAQEFLDAFRDAYPGYFKWQDGISDYAGLNCHIETVFGWGLNVSSRTKNTTVRNFLIQANSAEILRLALSFAIERGVMVCGTNHDSMLIEAATDQIHHAMAVTQKAMEDASAVVLGGYRLRTEAKIFANPDRFHDKKGELMWRKIWNMLAEVNSELNLIAGRCLWTPKGS